MRNPRHSGKAIAAMAGMALLFGASFVASKIALGEFTPAQLIFLRFLIAGVVFQALAPLSRGEPLDRRGHLRVLGLALLEPGIYFFLEAQGIQRTLASTAAVLISTIPVFVMILESAWFRVRIVAREVVLILVSLAGIVTLLTAAGVDKAIGGSLAGNLLVLGAAVSASLYTVFARSLVVRYSAMTVTRLQALWAVALYLPFAAWDTVKGGVPAVSGRALAALLYLGLGCSLVGYLLLNYALSRVKATVVAAFANLIPVVATALAIALLGERLFPAQIVGATVVIASVTALSLYRPEVEDASTVPH